MLLTKRKTKLEVHYMETLVPALHKAAAVADAAREHMAAGKLRVMAVEIEALLDRGIRVI